MRALVQTPTGYRYRGGAEGDDHIFTDKTDFQVDDAINTVVDAELEEATDDASTVASTVELVPRNGDDAPYEDFDLGDAVSSATMAGVRENHRAVSLRVQESRLAVPRYGVGLNSIVEDDVAKQQRWLRDITPGALSGRSDQVSAANLGAGISFGRLPTSSFTFQQSGYLVAEIDPDDVEDDGHSDPWPVDEPMLIYRIVWSLQQAGDTDTIVHIRRNGTLFHPLTIPDGVVGPDGDDAASEYTNQVAYKGDVITAATYQAGDYARGLVVRVKYTSQT